MIRILSLFVGTGKGKGGGMECPTENWLAISFYSYKSISILGMSCICELIERHQEVAEKKKDIGWGSGGEGEHCRQGK